MVKIELTVRRAGQCPQFGAVDRLTNHVHILKMNGESYRLATDKRRQQRNAKPNISSEKEVANP